VRGIRQNNAIESNLLAQNSSIPASTT